MRVSRGPGARRSGPKLLFEEYYRRHWDQCVGYVAKAFRLGHEDAQDVAQTAFTEVREIWDAHPYPERALWRRLGQRAVDEVRRQGRLRETFTSQLALEGMVIEVADGSFFADPAAYFESSETMQRLNGLLMLLTPEERAVVRMAAVGINGRERAGALDKSYGAQAVLLCRARKKLERIMNDGRVDLPDLPRQHRAGQTSGREARA
ncbi:sigma-70 family RNA polymerase sigma factor [Streptomyces sp. NPDC001137]|uniref:RNA polymerase sigma factor n=1 Tax=Streptomyces sp. NPDC001137 TaxID=3154378 RepID=UPI00332FF12E